MSYSQNGQIDQKKHISFSEGDTVGVLKERNLLRFTLNGKLVLPDAVVLSEGHEALVPAVCLTCCGDTVEFVNYNFVFDLLSYFRDSAKSYTDEIKRL
jgi:hypothetical protein